VSDLPRQADVVFIGAGHNALVAAAYLLEARRAGLPSRPLVGAAPGVRRRPGVVRARPGPQAAVAHALTGTGTGTGIGMSTPGD